MTTTMSGHRVMTGPGYPVPKRLATPTDLKPNEIKAVVEAVNPLVADSFALYVWVRRSSKAIDQTATQRAAWWRRTAPDPRARMTIELGGGEAGGVGDVIGAGQRDAGEGFAAEDAPPALDEVQPRRADRDEGMLDARMRG